MIPLALLGVPFVVPAVVLDDDPKPFEHQIPLCNPSSRTADDRDVHGRFGQPGEDQQKTHVGLTGRVDPLADQAGRITCANHTVEMPRGHVRPKCCEIGVALTHEPVPGAYEIAKPQESRTVHE